MDATCPRCPIEHVLTDNSSESEAHYEQACKDLEITHFWTYLSSPKMNAHSEHFNRTIQEEASFPEFSASIQEWNARIGYYIMQYNCYRPHVSLDYDCPMDRYVSLLCRTPQESRMYVGHTGNCQFPAPHVKGVPCPAGKRIENIPYADSE